MSTKLYVGSLPYTTTDDQLKEHFSQAGEVVSATVIMDKYSGRSKGFGFVEMADDKAAQEAISQLNGKELEGRSLNVSEARPREDRPQGGGGGGGYGGGGRDRGDRRY